MSLDFNKWVEVLENTPAAVSALLHDLSEEWTNQNEGEGTWTAKEVIAHLIVCEQTDWLPRIRLILSDNEDKTFAKIDMEAHFAISQGNSLPDLLAQFKEHRRNGIAELRSLNLQEQDFLKLGKHPVVGEINLQQLIATWVSHDMTHVTQIARIIARQNKGLVGGFNQYLRILS